MEPQDLKSRAGQLLYRELPLEYRYRDEPPTQGELGDLEAYLHGFGHLLDLIRGTTEQAYADAFAEPADNGREIQPWLIPYLAELVGAELRAPDPAARPAELNNTVDWYKAKGTLSAVDEISDVVSGAEAVVVEGWRTTLTTPRMSLPPFTAPADAMGSGDPAEAPGLPLGAPDIRFVNRAVIDEAGSNPLYALRSSQPDEFGRDQPVQEVFWKPLNRSAAPCFPGAYDDTSVRTPDVRAVGTADLGPHPKRSLVHVRPPQGFFVTWGDSSPFSINASAIEIDPDETTQQVFTPATLFEAQGLLADDQVDQLRVDGKIVLPDQVIVDGGVDVGGDADVHFEGLIFTGDIRLTSPNARVTMERCVADRIGLSFPTDDPALIANDCLFNRIRGGVGFAQLVYCTVLEETDVERLWASDCIFNGPLPSLDCSGDETCIRFSRVPDLEAVSACGADKSPSNTDADPNFIRLWFPDGDDCVLRPALFGEPGAGVLDLTSSSTVLAGAEDEGEMGAYHHRHHAASIRALELKLTDYLPFGQEIAIRYDPYLARPPANVAEEA